MFCDFVVTPRLVVATRDLISLQRVVVAKQRIMCLGNNRRAAEDNVLGSKGEVRLENIYSLR